MHATHLSNFFCGIFYNAVNISDYTIPTVGLKNSNSKRFGRKKLLPDRNTGMSHLKYLMLHCTHICQKNFKNVTLLQVFRLNLRMHFSSHTCYISRPFQWPMVQSIRSAAFPNFLLQAASYTPTTSAAVGSETSSRSKTKYHHPPPPHKTEWRQRRMVHNLIYATICTI